MSGDFLDLPAGRVLGGRYRIERRLAAGGMAAVFEATMVDLGRRVAVKTLHPHLSEDRRSVERLRREALAVAGLQDPNIVQILDFRCTPGEPAFLVMELLRGRTLFEVVQSEGPLPWPRAAAIARQLLGALETTQRAGILHRDLKPANVFLVPLGGGDDLVKLLDFGLAAVREGPGFEKLTRTGVVVGTPAYMAPEQARGEKVDRRADVYGAAAVLWTALAGRRPFEARTAGEVLVKVVAEAPPPLARLRPDLPPEVCAAVEGAMAKRPEDRFPDAASLAAALAAWAPPTVATPRVVDRRPGNGALREAGPSLPAPPAKASPPTRRRPWLLAAVAAGAILAGAAVAVVVWAAWQEAGGAEATSPVTTGASRCRRPGPGEPLSAFSADVRVVLCDRCLTPIEAPVGGGEVTCGGCGTTQVVPARDDRTPVAPAANPPITEAERARLREMQRDVPLRPSAFLERLIAPLLVDGSIPSGKVWEALEVWREIHRKVRETDDLDASKGLLQLTIMLGDSYDRTDNHRMQRALYESALDVVRLPAERQAIRAALSRGASLDGDTCSAEVWLTPNDLQCIDLDIDTHWRLGRALIDTVHGDWNAVLAVLGRTDDELPFRDYARTPVTLLRANAWEQLGRVDRAVEQLRAEIARRPKALAEYRKTRSNYQPIRLCPRSFEVIEASL